MKFKCYVSLLKLHHASCFDNSNQTGAVRTVEVITNAIVLRLKEVLSSCEVTSLNIVKDHPVLKL